MPDDGQGSRGPRVRPPAFEAEDIAMTKVDLVAGYLGAGKTTLIQKLLSCVCTRERVVFLENEYGAVRLSEEFLQSAAVQRAGLTSGCVCCGPSENFADTVRGIVEWQRPDRIVLEAAGTAVLSALIEKVRRMQDLELTLHSVITVADASRFRLYSRNFGQFYSDQIAHAQYLFLSRTECMDSAALRACIEQIRALNPTAAVIDTPWQALSGAELLRLIH